MIHYLVTSEHRYTADDFRRLEPSLAEAMAVVPYDEAAARGSFEPGTYVFSDLERLDAEGLKVATRIWERLEALGPEATLLNHPTRALRRYALQRKLHGLGVNEFDVHRLTDVLHGTAATVRFPAFLREEDDHTKSLSRLLVSMEDLHAAVVELDRPPENLLVVEWCDTSDDEGVFRKYGAFVVGDTIVPRHVLCSRYWAVSDYGLVDDEHLQESRDYLVENPHAGFLLDIARQAGIDYGRFDYALLGARPQIWEINTNPGVVHLSPEGIIDRELHALPGQRVAGALLAIEAKRRAGLRRTAGPDLEPASESGQTICLCMIVRNEAHVLPRCLHSVIDLIDSWVICDTGSTDETRETVMSILGDVPGELHETPWADFGENRTELMRRARGHADYLLLIDADMTVRRQGPLPPLDADAYMLRESGSFDFGVIRLVRGDRQWWYEGSTHEHIATDGHFRQVELPELVIDHHADGSARADKLIRDAGLLKRDLARNPDNARAVFYLAQTYRDLDKHDLAVEYYRRRVDMGGWEEEVFYANLQEGMLRARTDLDSAVPVLLEAWQRRQSRAEPLYELARAHRNRGDFAVAHMFAERGLEIPYPADVLFVHRWVYDWGLLLEHAIAAAGIGRLEEATADLRALEERRLPAPVAEYVADRLEDLQQWPGGRPPARTAHEPARLASLASSLRIGEIRLDVKPNWPAFNPSIANDGDGFRMIVRTANYEIDRGVLHDDGVLHNINYLLSLDEHLGVTAVEPVLDRSTGPLRHASQVQGYEDCRLVKVGDRWYATATVSDLTPTEVRQVALLEFDDADIVDVQGLGGPDPDRHEKNWMPFVVDGVLHLLYSCHPTVVLRCDPVSGTTTQVASHDAPEVAVGFRGGSQGVAVPDGYLFVVHEVDRSEPRLRYLHRFVLLGHDLVLESVSPRFTFTSDRVEFCAGMALGHGEVILSFGVSDAAAGLAVVATDDVLAMLEPVEIGAGQARYTWFPSSSA